MSDAQREHDEQLKMIVAVVSLLKVKGIGGIWPSGITSEDLGTIIDMATATIELLKTMVLQERTRAASAEDKLVAVPAYAHYFSVEALRLNLLGDMLGTPMTFDEWLAAVEQEPDDPFG